MVEIKVILALWFKHSTHTINILIYKDLFVSYEHITLITNTVIHSNCVIQHVQHAFVIFWPWCYTILSFWMYNDHLSYFFTQYQTFLCINFQVCTYFLLASSTLILLNYTLFLFPFQTVIKISSIYLATCVCISRTTTVKEEKIQQNTG